MNCVDCECTFDETIEIICPKCGSLISHTQNNFFLDIQNCVNFLHRMNRRLMLLERKLKKQLESDPRKQFGKSVIMFNLSEMVRLIQMPIDFANSNCTLERLIKENNEYSALLGAYEPILQKIVLFHQFSYLTLVLFRLEVMIKKICLALGYTGRLQYSSYCDYLVKEMSMVDSEMLDTLLFPSFFRNTLHNDGTFIDKEGQDREFTIRGIKFILEHGKSSSSAWRLMIFMINSLIPVVADIIEFSLHEKNLRHIR